MSEGLGDLRISAVLFIFLAGWWLNMKELIMSMKAISSRLFRKKKHL
jgi:hypothetical protein